MLTTGHSLTARGLSAQRGSLWPSRHRHFTRIPSGPPRPTASALLCPFHRWGHGLGWASVGFRPLAGEEEQESWETSPCTPLPPWVALEGADSSVPARQGGPIRARFIPGPGRLREPGCQHLPQPYTQAGICSGEARAPCSLPRTGDTRQGRCHDLSSDGPHLLWTKGTSVGPRAPQEKPQGPNSLSRVGYTAV